LNYFSISVFYGQISKERNFHVQFIVLGSDKERGISENDKDQRTFLVILELVEGQMGSPIKGQVKRKSTSPSKKIIFVKKKIDYLKQIIGFHLSDKSGRVPAECSNGFPVPSLD